MNDHWKSYFYYSRQEKRGILILSIILIGLLFYKYYLIQNPVKIGEITDSKLNKLYCQLEHNRVESDIKKQAYYQKQKFKTNQYRSKYRTSDVLELQIDDSFDPNNVSQGLLESMGLSNKIIKNWTKYLQSGAKFRGKEDIKKIYGITSDVYEQLAPFIDIKQLEKPILNNRDTSKYYKQKPKPTTLALIDINVADAEDLIPIYGVGPSLSTRIIKFRDKLGGFHDIGQLREVFGLPDSTYTELANKIIVIGQIQQINVNASSLEDLKQHPYIDYKLAKSIVKYREQHGPYRDWPDLQKLKLMSGHERIKPYLSY